MTIIISSRQNVLGESTAPSGFSFIEPDALAATIAAVPENWISKEERYCARIKSLENTIEQLQKDHSQSLTLLHSEIEKLTNQLSGRYI
jgi:hypothetical protein